ncbi:MAG TPA: hypothetical protein V6C97_35990 [Oculatellaceae cyanobacterium]
MKRLKYLLVFACCMCATTLFGVNAFAQNTTEIAKGNCSACVKKIEEVLDYCNEKGGRYSSGNVTTALKDALSACKMTDEYFARGSTLSAKAAHFNAEACINCAKTCESFKDDDKMNACANECRKTAGNCSKLQ